MMPMRGRRMRRFSCTIVVVTLFAASWGCSQKSPEASESHRPWLPRNVQGHWVLRDVDPPENASAFNILAVTFNPDQTYIMRLVKDGNRLETQRGTYRFDEWNRRLHLHTGGEQRSYTAMIWFGTTLRLDGQTPKGQAATATLVRSNLAVVPDAVPMERQRR